MGKCLFIAIVYCGVHGQNRYVDAGIKKRSS
jgi:hypothetical protein